MSQHTYETRITRVTDFIYAHLDEDLDLDRLADVAAMSRWHWHRVYAAMRGESVVATVRRLRLQRAASELANSDAPIEEVARRSGYDNIQSFTRIFADAYGMPPGRYRKEGSHTDFAPGRGAPIAHYEVRIVALPATEAFVEDHTGSYMEIGQAFDRLFSKLGARGMITPDVRMMGVYRDDPSAVPVDSLRSQAGAILGTAVNADLPRTALRAGEYAVLRHKGPYADMPGAYRWLFGTWLPQSRREAADAPVLEEYLNNPRDTPPADLLTDLYLPLA
jgi:AraC family transcriptional regulator